MFLLLQFFGPFARAITATITSTRTTAGDALALVLARLDARSLAASACVCSAWRALVQTAWTRVSLDGDARAGTILRALAAHRPDILARVETLSLEFARAVTDDDFCHLLLPSLSHVNLNATQAVGDTAVQHLARTCSHLQSVSLYWNVRVTDTSLVELCTSANASTIVSLNLSGCKLLSDATMAAVASRLPALRELDLTRCLGLSDASVVSLAAGVNAAQLRCLVLYADNQFTAAGLKPLMSAMSFSSCLEKLDLCGAQHLTDDCLNAMLAKQQPLALTWLNLTWCPLLTDASLVPLATNCPALEWLSVHGNGNVTADFLDALEHSGCKITLTALDVRGCSSIHATQRSKAALGGRFPQLRTFALHS